MLLKIAYSTHQGGRRNNQDYYAYKEVEDGALLVLADGMGGHQHGELASHFFCEACIEQLQPLRKALADDPCTAIKQLVVEAAEAMQQHLHDESPGVDAHTTCNLCWVSDQQVVSAHVGDSRLYRFSSEELIWRTSDHSITQLLVMQGEITEEEAVRHPDQSKLYRSIGPSGEPKPSVKSLPPLESGELLLLCSDGLWTETSESQMMALVNAEPLQQALESLVDETAVRVGTSSDNITALAARRCE